MSTLDTFRFASTEKLERAYLAGELSLEDAKVLLARKDYTMKQVGYLLKDWKSTKRFRMEEGR